MWRNSVYYYKGKSACSWDFQYHLPTSSCQRTLWMTSKFVASSFINHFLQCLRFFENVLVVRLFLSTHIFLEIPYLEKIDKTQIKLPVHLIITKDEQKCTRKSQHAWFIFIELLAYFWFLVSYNFSIQMPGTYVKLQRICVCVPSKLQ